MIGGGGITNEEKGEFCDSQKSRRGDITYFWERTGRILREDIKVCKLYIHNNSRAGLGRIISRFTHLQLLVGSNLLKGKDTDKLHIGVPVLVIEYPTASLRLICVITKRIFTLIANISSIYNFLCGLNLGYIWVYSYIFNWYLMACQLDDFLINT